MNNKGFTLIEVIIATFLGLAMMHTILMVPINMAEMHFFVSDNIRLVQDSNIVSSYIYKDIAKGITTVTDSPAEGCIKIENMINVELKYCFSENGIIRREDGESKLLSELNAEYQLILDTLKITIHYDEANAPSELEYLFKYPILETGGGL